uniref:Uncharacterized protein n=1 Tax=Anguilla anguilla TaxID=7936 RepID=A0A0E9TXA9_ANGAN
MTPNCLLVTVAETQHLEHFVIVQPSPIIHDYQTFLVLYSSRVDP